MTTPTPDAELTLTRGDLRLVVSPYGASLRGMFRQNTEIITGYSGAANKAGGQGDVLIPFPGRVGQGRYAFEGQTYQMEINDKEAPNAIHGFLRAVIWDQDALTEDSVTFSTAFDADANPGYPFALRAQVTYTITETGMTCAVAVRNTGTTDAPVAAGFHPYFTVGSALINADTLHVPFGATLEYNENLIPTGAVLPVEGTPFDFRQPRTLGGTVFNTCYLQPQRDPDGWARIRLSEGPNGRSVTVALDPSFNYVVLYSGDPLPETHRRRALAIEPMTCASDAFNHPNWGLAVLKPGETLAGTWTVTSEAG